MDLIAQIYQQMHMLSLVHNPEYKRLLRYFQVALDLQEHITVSLSQPDEVQKLVEKVRPRRYYAAMLRSLPSDLKRLPTIFCITVIPNISRWIMSYRR